MLGLGKLVIIITIKVKKIIKNNDWSNLFLISISHLLLVIMSVLLINFTTSPNKSPTKKGPTILAIFYIAPIFFFFWPMSFLSLFPHGAL